MKKEIFVEMIEAPIVLIESLKLTNFWLISVYKNLVVQLSKMAENILYRMEKVCCFFKQVHSSSLCLCEVRGCCCLTLWFCCLFSYLLVSSALLYLPGLSFVSF